MKLHFLVNTNWTLSEAIVVLGMVVLIACADKIINKYQDWHEKKDKKS